MPQPWKPAGRAVMAVTLLVAVGFASPASAVLDIGNGGPSLQAGRFTMRVTNAGIVGNAFFDVGLSNDASFEFPSRSGIECLNYASLWVGARDSRGERVSGGPPLEWRPTLAPDDRVRAVQRGDPFSRRGLDDDGDGAVDEESLNGRDDDGDGRIDEDLATPADQMLAADYRDDEPAAIYSTYPGGEPHVPLGLAVHQEAYAWSHADLDEIAALTFHVTNVGAERLTDVCLGFFADLDARLRTDRTGHLNDLFASSRASVSMVTGRYSVTARGTRLHNELCVADFDADIAAVHDRNDPTMPWIGVMPLDHTTDPLARLQGAQSFARAPAEPQFRIQRFTNAVSQQRGQVPRLDHERYDALRGGWLPYNSDEPTDAAVLVSCGPFPWIDPGESLDFAVALVAGRDLEELTENAQHALFLYEGVEANLLPDSLPADEMNQYLGGATGTYGHEVCVRAPPGETFVADPHCVRNLPEELELPRSSALYTDDRCIWTNADCDLCTPGTQGAETRIHWRETKDAPPAPTTELRPGDRRVTIAWDNLPEILLNAGLYGAPSSRFQGYRLYKVSDWRGRLGEFPSAEHWSLLAEFSAIRGDTLHGETALARAVDSLVVSTEMRYEQPYYPVGRYAYVDSTLLNGFTYAYVVTSVYRDRSAFPLEERIETALITSPRALAVPHVTARATAGGVWVVPNPYRGSAPWDRPAILHDALTHHIDFMGLPRDLSTIKIWTLAGDLVETIRHDGRGGDGQAAWNLVTRNGQDVASGVYLFTVESRGDTQRGRFVIIR